MPKATMPVQGEFKKIDAGVFPARVYSVIDLGTQKGSFNGKDKMKRKIRVVWEFPTKKAVFDEAKGEQPFVLANEYTLSLFDTAPLRTDVENWLGRPLTPQELAEGYDVANLIGTTGLAQVQHQAGVNDATKTFAVIASLMPLPEGMVCPPAVNPVANVEMEDWKTSKFDALPEFVQKKIKNSVEWKENFGAPEFDQKAVPEFTDADVPGIGEPRDKFDFSKVESIHAKKDDEIHVEDIPF